MVQVNGRKSLPRRNVGAFALLEKPGKATRRKMGAPLGGEGRPIHPRFAKTFSLLFLRSTAVERTLRARATAPTHRGARGFDFPMVPWVAPRLMKESSDAHQKAALSDFYTTGSNSRNATS